MKILCRLLWLSIGKHFVLNISCGLEETGESQALWIAHKMDMSMKLIHQAERYLAEKPIGHRKEFLPKTAVTNRKENKKNVSSLQKVIGYLSMNTKKKR